MSGGGEERKGNDLYAVLGLEKKCTTTELRDAYKKLAMRWHPDRCSASGSSKSAEEAKQKFQDIQEAYSVLSDHNKRLLYDVGIYDEDDDDNNNGMDEFLNEMTAMMSQSKPGENGGDSFEELQELFKEIFQRDIDTSATTPSSSMLPRSSSPSSFHPYAARGEASNTNSNYKNSSYKRNSSQMGPRLCSSSSPSFNASFHGFCVGLDHQGDRRETTGSRGRAAEDEAAAGNKRSRPATMFPGVT